VVAPAPIASTAYAKPSSTPVHGAASMTPASVATETASCARHPHGMITTIPLRRQTCAVAKRSTGPATTVL
jgi:hypothetical protein